ncbi:iron ABC transporter permease [Microvirga sp. W0021]|uniref:Iron ABC transporter permease n=1 Tax=Hohaiivirga grylli TaxID=3133970 RepID=A0ABV0BGW7_9HYPH
MENRRLAKQAVAFLILSVVLLGSIFFGLCAGRFSITPARALEIVFNWLFTPGLLINQIDERIILLVRIPRIILAGFAGAGLAVAGAALQAVFRNPLVSPQILGISPGAAFGGVLAIVLGWWGLALLGLSFASGLIALVFVGLLARINGRSEIITVILAGIVISALFGALVSLSQFLADPNGSLPAIVYWLMGSMASATWQKLTLAAPGLIMGTLLIMAMRFRLNILSLDDAEARSLGANPDIERWIIFLAVTIIVGSQVSVSGVIGWIGLVIPHTVRMIMGQDNRVVIPASAILGAAFLIFADTLARTMTAAEIPLGALTALVGAPVFAVLLRSHYRERMQ